MVAVDAMSPYISLNDVAAAAGIDVKQLGDMYARRVLPEPDRLVDGSPRWSTRRFAAFLVSRSQIRIDGDE